MYWYWIVPIVVLYLTLGYWFACNAYNYKRQLKKQWEDDLSTEIGAVVVLWLPLVALALLGILVMMRCESKHTSKARKPFWPRILHSEVEGE